MCIRDRLTVGPAELHQGRVDWDANRNLQTTEIQVGYAAHILKEIKIDPPFDFVSHRITRKTMLSQMGKVSKRLVSSFKSLVSRD